MGGSGQEDRHRTPLRDIGLPLNDANFHLKVNMLKYKETNKKGEIKRFSWVTNLPLDRDTVTLIMPPQMGH